MVLEIAKASVVEFLRLTFVPKVNPLSDEVF